MRIVFLGPPGVGKGTQAEIFCRDRGYRHISTGDLLRDAVERETPLGTTAKAYMNSGDLVPGSVILGLIQETLEDVPGGVVFDGFPRTLNQAEDLDNLLKERGEQVDRVILLRANEEEIVRRVLARGRTDDTLETVTHRIAVYKQNTAPLVDYYHHRGVVREIDGMGPIPQIQERIVAQIDEN